MTNLHIESPLIESLALSRLTGNSVYLKLEAFQPSGSFKNRGIGLLCQDYKKRGKKLFVSSSGGNAGLAVAYSGRKLEVPVKVIVPKTTPPMMRAKLELEGAEVIVHGENWNEADLLARKLCADFDGAYISPFDNPLIWQGHSSMIHEVERSGYKPDAVLLSVGGGGLYCGVVQGLQDVGWNNLPVITAETEGAASFYEAVRAGKPVTLDRINTIATSLGARRVAEQAFQFSQKHPTHPQIVSDSDSLKACFGLVNDHRILVEPSCGATLSLLYQKHPILKDYKTVLAIVCGGNSVDLSLLKQWALQTGLNLNDYI